MARKVYASEFLESVVRVASERNAWMAKIAIELLGIARWTLGPALAADALRWRP